jgi:CRISPR/Cas system CSM-associated protein Csm4 (group 5 of RAMP superfamily)
MFDNTFTKEQIIDRLNQIGKVGFGKKGSIGKGHFRAEIDTEFRGFDVTSHYPPKKTQTCNYFKI